MLMSIYRFHRYVRGWNDIGYNFAIDLFGRIWEARAGGIDEAVIGAQAGGYNTVSTGVAVLGTFDDVVPSPAAVAALERLLAWKLSLHGIPVRGRVTVEVDPADASYTPFAPGSHVRCRGSRATETATRPAVPATRSTPACRRFARAWRRSPGRPRRSRSSPTRRSSSPAPRRRCPGGCAGSRARRSRALCWSSRRHPPRGDTLQAATSGADGSWSARLAPANSLVLRALHRAPPASVSDLVLIDVAPAIALSVVSSAPLRATGTVSPRKPVTINLYAVAPGGRQRLLTSQRLAATGGRFTAQLATGHHGPVRLIARTVADAGNAAGESAPVDVAI